MIPLDLDYLCDAPVYYQHEETGYQVELPCSLGRGHSGECMPDHVPGPRYWPITPTAQGGERGGREA